MQSEVWPASVSSVWAQSSNLDSNRKRSPSSSRCKASCIGGLHGELDQDRRRTRAYEARLLMAPLTCSSILLPLPRPGRARHTCRLGRQEDRRRSTPCSSHRGDRTAPADFASMPAHELLSSNEPFE